MSGESDGISGISWMSSISIRLKEVLNEVKAIIIRQKDSLYKIERNNATGVNLS